jgi:hypothetical protein
MAPDRDEWSDSHFGHFTSIKRTNLTWWIGLPVWIQHIVYGRKIFNENYDCKLNT